MLGFFRRRKENKAQTQIAPEYGCIVWDRAQLAEYIGKTVGFDAVGSTAEFVERVMVLQNDISRPTYIVEVNAEITQNGISVIRDAMIGAGVSCVLVPVNTLNVVAQLTPDGMGVKNGGLYGDMMHSAQNAAVAVETIERQTKEG